MPEIECQKLNLKGGVNLNNIQKVIKIYGLFNLYDYTQIDSFKQPADQAVDKFNKKYIYMHLTELHKSSFSC